MHVYFDIAICFPATTIGCATPYDGITGSGITIISPSHPNIYSNNQNCETTFDLSSLGDNKRITIKFEAFDIEFHSSCRYDYVEFRTKDADGALIGTRKCGDTVPDPIQASTDMVHMKFYTDYSVVKTGFKIQMMGE